jgi:hypothetical protein
VSLAALPRSPKWGGLATAEPGFSTRLTVLLKVSASDWFDMFWLGCVWREMDWLGFAGEMD